MLILMLVVSSCSPSLAVSQIYSFKHYSSADGLELSSNNTIFQDSRGSLWFGGFGGAFRYDGNRFIPYLSKGSERSVVTRFAEDHTGMIWIATEGNGIAKIGYDGNNTIEWMKASQKSLPSDSVYALLCDSSGTMFVGTKKGVKVFWSDGSSTLLTKDSGLYSNWARIMVRDHEGGIWIGTNGGVTRYTVRHNEIVSWKKILDATTLSLIVRKDGTVVIGTMEGKNEENKGVFGYQNNTLYRIIDPNDFTDPIKTQSLLEDSRGNLWIGTTRGIIIKNGTQLSCIQTSQGLPSEAIGCIVEDRDGSIWCATGNGAVKLPSRYTVNFSELQGIAGILTVMADKSNTIWCGGFSPLYTIGALSKVQNMNDDPLLKDLVFICMTQDREGNIWLGTLRGLLKYNGRSFDRQWIGNDPPSTLISSLAADPNGGIWVGLKGSVLNIKNGKMVETFNWNDGIPDDDLSALLIDRKGRLWFGSDHGVGMIENRQLTMFTIKDGLPCDEVESIKEDSHGRIWCVTRTGVVYRKDGEFFQLSQKQIPLDDVRVTVVHEDSSGHLWFGTMNGVTEWSDSVLARYDTRDGLSGDIVRGIAEDTEGNLWFATNGGLTKFPHSERMSNIPTPSVRIERISGEASQDIVTHQTVIPYEERTVTFQAVSFSFYDERNMEFQFMLDGIEHEWNMPTKHRTIRYTTLPSGHYTVNVRARNRNGYWTEPSQYSFEILPPFWRTWWFIGMIAIIFSGSGYGVIKQRINRLRKEAQSQELFSKQLMEVYESERKRIASELHDGLGQNLLIIANRAKMGLRKEERSSMQKEFEIISDSALESINDVRKITYNLHPLQIDEIGITTAVESMLKRVATLIDNALTFTIEQIDDLLPKEKQIHLYRIIQETLNNSIKHSGAQNIEVIVVKEGQSIRTIIKDDGKGFDPKIKKEGYGMRSLNERVKILNGQYAVESSPGKGAVIKINIPVG
jgi:ligand-binding sensor domain-containing protein